MPVPEVTSSLTASGTVYAPFDYQITATNSPLDNEYTATPLPPWATLRFDGAILGNPTLPGVFSIVLGAANSAGSGPQVTLTLTIAPAAGSPVVTSATTASGTVGTAFSYQAAATNSPTGYTLTEMVAGQSVPATVPGLSLDATTGLLTGTPTTAGTYAYNLYASNADGPGAAVTLTITITGGSGGTGTGGGGIATGTFTVASTPSPVLAGAMVALAFTGTGTNFYTGQEFIASAGTLSNVVVTSATAAMANFAAPSQAGMVVIALGNSSAKNPIFTLLTVDTATGQPPPVGVGTGGGTGPAAPVGDVSGTGAGYTTPAGTVVDYIGRLILGQDLDGSYVTCGAVITEALQYAISAGAPFQIGAVDATTRCSSTIALGYQITLDEVKDVTCAEVFRLMARWLPNCVQWFDYTTTPPTLHFQPPGAAATVTMGEPPLVSVGELTPRHDLQASAVVLHYEVTTSANGANSLSLLTDAAPAGATGKEFGAVVLTIPMRGQSSTSIQQRVQTTAIKDTVGVSGLVAYLAGRCPALAADVNDPNVTASGITINTCSRTLSDPSADAYNPATGEYGAQVGYDDSLGNELVSGAITDWMVSQYAIKSQEQVITFSWTADSSADGTASAADLSDVKKATITIKATNAVTQVYTSLTSFNQGDTPPAGLAASYLATISALQWSGNVELVEQTAGATVPAAVLGNTLNIAGSANAAWATMNALIVGETVQASTGRTTLRLGPSKHLSLPDMVSRLRITRPGGMSGRQDTGAKGTTSSDARATGQASGNTAVPGATEFPVKSSSMITSGGGGTSSPTPFQFLQTAPGTNSFLLIENSYFREDANSPTNTPMSNSTTAMPLSAGDNVWLQLDATSDGRGLQEASIVSGQDPPYQSGGSYVKTADDGNGNQIWDVSYYPLAQVFPADSSGQPVRGGLVYTVDNQQPPTQIEVVQLADTHLALEQVAASGVMAYAAFPGAAPLLSDDA